MKLPSDESLNAASAPRAQERPQGAVAGAPVLPETGTAARAGGASGPLYRRAVLYPGPYVWYVFLSSLDIMMTWIVLHAGGFELNFLADWVIHHGGLPGTVAYKFGLVMLVVVICEVVGRVNDAVGRRLAEWSVAITVIPVLLAFVQLGIDLWRMVEG